MRDEDRLEGTRVRGAELANLEVLRRQAAGAAHTLNNVFTALLGELALLADERKDDPVVDEAVLALRGQLERCVKLVRNGLSRPPLDAVSAGEVDLGLLLSRCVRILDGTLPRRVTLTTRIPDESWLVQGDAAEIEVLLLGLIFRLGDLVPCGCLDVWVSLAEGSGPGRLALHVDLATPDLPDDARQRLVDPGLAGDPIQAATLEAIHAIADRHGSHLRTERIGAGSLRLSLEFVRLEP